MSDPMDHHREVKLNFINNQRIANQNTQYSDTLSELNDGLDQYFEQSYEPTSPASMTGRGISDLDETSTARRLDTVEHRIGNVERQLGRMDHRLGDVEKRLASMEKKMEDKLDAMQSMLQLLLAQKTSPRVTPRQSPTMDLIVTPSIAAAVELTETRRSFPDPEPISTPCVPLPELGPPEEEEEEEEENPYLPSPDYQNGGRIGIRGTLEDDPGWETIHPSPTRPLQEIRVWPNVRTTVGERPAEDPPPQLRVREAPSHG